MIQDTKIGIEFLDIIFTGTAYIERWRNYFSGKYEIIEIPSSYFQYSYYIKNKKP